MISRNLKNLTILYRNHEDLLKEDAFYYDMENIIKSAENKILSEKIKESYVTQRVGRFKFLIIFGDYNRTPPLSLIYMDTKEKIFALQILHTDIKTLDVETFKDKCGLLGSEFAKSYETPNVKESIKELLDEIDR